jgi:hypothetical protein
LLLFGNERLPPLDDRLSATQSQSLVESIALTTGPAVRFHGIFSRASTQRFSAMWKNSIE